ncbi:MAG: hypothetical protein ACKVT1_17350 [Dehalococcoidia bacterium]
MSEVLVLYPGEAPAAVAESAGVRLSRYATAAEVAEALRGRTEAVLIVRGDLSGAEITALAGAVSAAGTRVIEVRSAVWDGETASALSAACRGVISGFGERGVLRAVELILREQQTAEFG